MDNNWSFEEIRKNILNEFNLKPGDKINYELVCEIAHFSGLDDKTVANDVLKIPNKSIYKLKENPNTKATILLEDYKRRFEEIKNQIITNPDLLPINYTICYSELEYLANKFDVSARGTSKEGVPYKQFKFK